MEEASKNKGWLLKKSLSGKYSQKSPIREAGEGRMKRETVGSIKKISKGALKPGLKKVMWQKWEAEEAKLMGREAKLAVNGLLEMTLAKQLTVTMREEKMGEECQNWGVVEDLGGVRNMEEEAPVSMGGGEVKTRGGEGKMGGDGVKMGAGKVEMKGKEGKGARVRGSILAAAATAVEKNLRNNCQWKLRGGVEEGWRGKVEGEATRRCSTAVKIFSAQVMPIFAPGVTQLAQCGGTSGSKAGQGWAPAGEKAEEGPR